MQLIIRNHCTEEQDGAANAEAKVAGKKRNCGSKVGTEGDSASGSGAGATTEMGGGKTAGVEGGSEKMKEQKRREAAVSAFLKDLPHTLLKLLLKDAKMRTMAIGS